MGLVKRRVAERHAGLGGLAHFQQRVAHARVGLVRRIVLGVRHGGLEVLHGVFVVVQRRVGHAQVVVHRAARIVSLVGDGLRIRLDSLVRHLQLHKAVADLVVQLARLTRGDRVRCILQALLVRLKRALIILLRVGASGLLE